VGRQKPRAAVNVLLLFFMGAFAAEVSTILLSLLIKDLVVQSSFFFLTGITVIAMALFFVEGTLLYRKIKPKNN
jgi:hypothetical protein